MTSRLPPDRMDDRRRRNGESAKRSRQKRKVALQDVEGNYCKLITGQAALSEENAKLKELLTTLTAGPEEQSPEDGDARAKRVKASGPRVVLMAKSVESEDTHHRASQQPERTHPRAMTTTVLLTICLQAAASIPSISPTTWSGCTRTTSLPPSRQAQTPSLAPSMMMPCHSRSEIDPGG
eukprot:TRINITY_DN5317_c0_g1_i2.p1 TRINITY_DN5317_c0_g1~~TRINITY_DN5317_c0_g1_i2.p1  ORF type:complete len:180 (+),score=29.49 TRINITY_DN5317_c0_g1_i2:238-777(+)